VGNAAVDRRCAVAAYQVRQSLVGGIATSALVAAAAPFAIPLVYGTAFRGATIPLLLLMPATIANCACATTEASLVALGQPGRASFGQISGTALTVVGLLIFLRRFGLPAAAIITSVDSVVTLLVQLIFLRALGVSGMRPRLADLAEGARYLTARIATGSATIGGPRRSTSLRGPHRQRGAKPLPAGHEYRAR
jgi:O-antigen/teichoic acid export membrane protein